MVGGYVATGYSGRSTGEVEDELSRYYEWYDIDRIFLDQQSASTDQVGYYEELYEYVKDQSGSSIIIVVTNAEVPVLQAYIDMAEIIIVYENSALPGDVLQDWMKDYNNSHFGMLPYRTSVSESQYDDLHEQVGCVYVASEASWMEVKGSVIDEQAYWAGD